MESDLEALWDYDDPVGSEARFLEVLPRAEAAGDPAYLAELLTRLARTQGLQMRFEEADRTLDRAQSMIAPDMPELKVRLLLERGRVRNSSGHPAASTPLFEESFEAATNSGLDGLAVDAAHMLAITYSGTPDAIAWNQRGLDIARSSTDHKARALIPAMLNNTAWDLHDLGRFSEALPLFEEAQAEWIARGQPTQIQIAKWAVARCLRSLGRHDDALAIQRALEAEHMAAGSADGYVFEEIAKNLAALGRLDEARPYFGRAADELGKDDWFVQNEAARLANLKLRAGRE